MLENKTKELVKEMNEVMDFAVKPLLTMSSIEYMGAEEFEVIKRMFKLMKSASELSIETSAQLDRIESKLNKLAK